MQFFDALIIYLACGSPMAVYHYFNRAAGSRLSRFATALLVALVWPYFLARHLLTRNTSAKRFGDPKISFIQDKDTHAEIERLRRRMELAIFEGKPSSELTDFRVVFDRYCGLSLALSQDWPAGDAIPELFRVSGHENAQIAAACLNRRNRSKLLRHQIDARKNFLAMVGASAGKDGLDEAAAELVSIIGDRECEPVEVFADVPQIREPLNVSTLEREVWSSSIPKPPAAKQISTT